MRFQCRRPTRDGAACVIGVCVEQQLSAQLPAVAVRRDVEGNVDRLCCEDELTQIGLGSAWQRQNAVHGCQTSAQQPDAARERVVPSVVCAVLQIG